MVSWNGPAGSDASTSTTPSSPASPRVNFGGVTSVSRQVTNNERWKLYKFDMHAQECPSCDDPYLRYKGGKKLCRDGEHLALEVSRSMLRRDGHIVSRLREDGKRVRIELPAEYSRSALLLKAIDRSERAGVHFLPVERRSTPPSSPPTSLSPTSTPSPIPQPRTPSITPRGNPQPSLQRRYSTSSRALPIRQPSRDIPIDSRNWMFGDPAATSPPRYRPTQPVAQLLPAFDIRQPRSYTYPAVGGSPRSSKRGSLYEEDLMRLREQQRREEQLYSLEVREPPRRLHSSAPRRREARPLSGIFF